MFIYKPDMSFMQAHKRRRECWVGAVLYTTYLICIVAAVTDLGTQGDW